MRVKFETDSSSLHTQDFWSGGRGGVVYLFIWLFENSAVKKLGGELRTDCRNINKASIVT